MTGHGHAIDMDMQLVLAARPFRVDRQPNGFSRQRTAEARLDQCLSAPSHGKYRRRVRREHLRIFDARDAPSWNGKHLSDADQVLQDRHALVDAAIEIDALARLRPQPRLEMGHARVMNDAP